MKNLSILTLFLALFLWACEDKNEQKPFNGLNTHMGNLYRMSDAQSRSISPENFTGEKGKGGMATLEEGNAAKAARELGQGWKVNPYIFIQPDEEFTLAEIDGEGCIQHIWMTPSCDYRLTIIKFYWDGETEPSVEVPVGDFFAAGWGRGFEQTISSLAVCVNPKSGFNCYWQMPFRKKCKVTMENLDKKSARLYYQIDYTLTDVPDDAAYFHAQFRREHPLAPMTDFTIVDDIKGKGQYVGTYLARGTYDDDWWGEGEIKFFMDGDTEFPTICGTGEEDYFCGSYGYDDASDEDGVMQHKAYSNAYTGFNYRKDRTEGSYESIISQYRWHVTDPIRFESDLRITIQSLGWQSGGRYKHLEDDVASVAYWYQSEPHNPFPELPAPEKLVVKHGAKR